MEEIVNDLWVGELYHSLGWGQHRLGEWWHGDTVRCLRHLEVTQNCVDPQHSSLLLRWELGLGAEGGATEGPRLAMRALLHT